MITATEAARARTEVQVREMASRFADAAAQPNASAEARWNAQTASCIVEEAELRASHVSSEEGWRRREAIEDWIEERVAPILSEIASHVEAGALTGAAEVVAATEALASIKAERARRQSEIELWLAEHALAAWTEASERLAALARGGDPFSGASKARH